MTQTWYNFFIKFERSRVFIFIFSIHLKRSIKNADDLIRTADLWRLKQPIYQLNRKKFLYPLQTFFNPFQVRIINRNVRKKLLTRIYRNRHLNKSSRWEKLLTHSQSFIHLIKRLWSRPYLPRFSSYVQGEVGEVVSNDTLFWPLYR